MGGRAVSGVLYLLSNAAISRVITFVTQIILAWLLLPSAFGLVGLTYTVSTFIQLLQVGGVHDVLVHRKVFRVWSGPAFWMVLLSGLAGGVIMLIASPIAVSVYDEPKLYGMLGIMALTSVVTPLSILPRAVLSRELRFKAMAFVELGQTLLKAVLSVAFALMGLGAYSFVLPLPIVVLASSIVLWLWVRPDMRWRVRFRRWRYLFGDSTRVLGAGFARTAALQSSYMVLGIVSTNTMVGLFFFAFQIALQPIMLLSVNLMKVLFPVLSSLKKEPKRQAQAFMRAQKALVAFALPLCLIQAAIGEPLIHLLFDEKWYDAIIAFQILSIGVAGRVANAPAIALIKAQGRFRTFLWTVTIYACCQIALIAGAFVAQDPYLWVIMSVASVSLLFGPVTTAIATQPTGTAVKSVKETFLVPGVLSFSLIGSIWLLSTRLPYEGVLGDLLQIAVAQVGTESRQFFMTSTTPDQFRILWIGNGDERYGVGSAILNLMRLMRERGHDARLLTLKPGYLEDVSRKEGIKTYPLKDVESFHPFAGGPIRQFAAVMQNKKNAKRAVQSALHELGDWRPDVVHSQWPTHAQFAGMLGQRLDAKPIWEMPNIINREIPLDLAWRFYNHIVRRYGIKILSNSAFTGRTIASKHTHPTVFHLGIDDERFDPLKVQAVPRERIGVPEDAFLLGVAARLSKQKGQDKVVEAVCRLIKKGNRDLHLVLMGGPVDGAFAESLRETALRYGATDHVHLVGPVEQPETYYASLDVSINFRIDPEPFGLSVVESMMMGVPVIAHSLGGPAETVIDGETGWHVSTPTADALEEVIDSAYRDRQQWGRRSEEIRQYAVRHFGRDTSYQSPISKQKAYHSRLEGVKKVFIIGVGRSGTHWLCKILSSHPEISGSEEELGRIFGRLLGLVTQNAQPAGQDWDYIIQTYRRLHALCAPRHLVDQSHPLIWYAEAIREVFPDALFIGTHRSALGCVSSMLKHPTVRAWAEKPFDHDLPNPFLGVTRENQDQFESFSLAERGIGAFLGGGTFIGRGKSFEWFGENAKRTGKGIIFGAGVPSHELWSRGGLPQMSDGHLIEDILPACQFVGVRGPDSAARLKQLGFDCKITSDPVFFLSQGNDYWQPEEKTIGLNVGIDDGGPVLGEAEQITQACADALLSYAQKGWKIKVFVVRPSDQVAAMQVLQTLPTSSVEVMSFYTDHMAYLDEVRTTRAFIGYKMHATALAICAGVPSLMLEYRPKTPTIFW
eukprot:g12198.t1